MTFFSVYLSSVTDFHLFLSILRLIKNIGIAVMTLKNNISNKFVELLKVFVLNVIYTMNNLMFAKLKVIYRK